MSKYRCWMRSAILAGSVFFAVCTSNKYTDFPCATIIVGNVNLIRKGSTVPLIPNTYLRPGDTVVTGQNAKLKLELLDSAFWYLGYGSRLAIEPSIPIDNRNRRMNARLVQGALYIVKRTIGREEHGISTKKWNFRITTADICITSHSQDDSTDVLLLNGFTAFALSGGSETIIPVCSHLVALKDGTSELQPVTQVDIAALKSWVGVSIVESAYSISGCAVPAEASPLINNALQKNSTPPEWKRLPGETVSLGDQVVDTIEAVDPEGQQVTYSLLASPENTTLDSISGKLTYRAVAPGVCTLSISATDALGNRCTTKVAITITSGLSVQLAAPSMVEPGKPFTVIATVGKQFKPLSPEYRFDLDGDGIFEIPGKGKFGKNAFVKKQASTTEGVVNIKVEVRITSGQTARANRTITVNAPPVAHLTVIPSATYPGEPVQFDISNSKDTRNGTIPLSVRYDVDGDGHFDLPEKGEALTMSVVQYAFKEPGVYNVIAQVTDKDGASDTASAKVTVSNKLHAGSIAAPDTINVNDSITLAYTFTDAKLSIEEYSWEISGAIQLARKTTVPAITTVFPKAGIVTVTCNVAASDKQQATATKKIVIVNSKTVVDAGGPYKTSVNKECTFTGTAQDADSRIKGYSWDMNNDGVPEGTSSKTPDFRYTFKKAGTFTIKFTVETDDGEKNSDEAIVMVGNRPPSANAGEDIVSFKDKKVTLTGTGTDPDGSIALYEWDFEGDGTYNWSSKEHGTVAHVFTHYTYPVFRVTDGDGATATDTLRIIICPDRMQTVEAGKFCIDQYEFPNRQKSLPQTDVSYDEANTTCSNLGKRLCTSEEWERACTGKQKGTVYPYGKEYQANKCNTLGNPHIKNSLTVSGEFTECGNAAGIFDMSGNAAEWTSEKDGIQYVYGGSWQNGENESTCKSRVALQKNKKYFYAGFRCCK